MVALVQRVSEASVHIDGRYVAHIGGGILVLLGIHRKDGLDQARWLARKCAHLRIFSDAEGKMNRSLIDTGGEALVVSQFTLYGDPSRGHRPSYSESAPPDLAEPLYERFTEILSEEIRRPVASGVFGAMMSVRLVNDGPVTLWVEKAPDP
jgi:D-aminoacyl-tRNA deacylase